MPTVLAFIIIASGIILYQSIALVGQVYSLQSSADDLQLMEYATNTKRVINEYEPKNKCMQTTGLEYQQTDGGNYLFEINCIYTDTDNDKYNKQVDWLLNREQLDLEQYNQVANTSNKTNSKITADNEVEITTSSDKWESKYDQQLYIGLLSYAQNGLQHKIVIFNQDAEIIKNINVKIK